MIRSRNPKRDIISFQKAVIIGALVLCVYIVVSFILYGNQYLQAVFCDIFLPIVGFLAVLCLIYAAIRSRSYGNRVYWAWLLIVFAMFLYTMGDALWTFLELFLQVEPFPSPADILYLLYYVFFAIGLLLLLRPLETPEKIYKTILDSLIVIVSATLIFWNTLLSFVVIIQNEATLAFSLSLYYIIRDLVIFLLLVNLTLRQVDEWVRDPLLLMNSAILVLMITDAVFSYQFLHGTYIPGSLTDAGWLLGYILIGLAGILQGNSAGVKLPKTAFQMQKPRKFIIFSFPLIWVALAFFMLFFGYYYLPAENFVIIQIKVIIFFLLLIIRLTISINEKWQFYFRIRRI